MRPPPAPQKHPLYTSPKMAFKGRPKSLNFKVKFKTLSDGFVAQIWPLDEGIRWGRLAPLMRLSLNCE